MLPTTWRSNTYRPTHNKFTGSYTCYYMIKVMAPILTVIFILCQIYMNLAMVSKTNVSRFRSSVMDMLDLSRHHTHDNHKARSRSWDSRNGDNSFKFKFGITSVNNTDRIRTQSSKPDKVQNQLNNQVINHATGAPSQSYEEHIERRMLSPADALLPVDENKGSTQSIFDIFKRNIVDDKKRYFS